MNEHTLMKKMQEDGRELWNSSTQKNQQRTLQNHKKTQKNPK